MLKIAIIVGSTRPNRKGEAVGRWVHEIAAKRSDAEFELVDVGDYDLPLLDEPQPPSLGNYARPHTNNWAQKIRSFDGFVFVTAEYNHSVPAALKNAIDFVYQEWNNKAAGFVSYGAAGGVRAVEHLRLALAEVQVADVANQVPLLLAADFENYSTFAPRPMQQDMLTAMLDQLIAWSGALLPLRDGDHSRP